MRGAVMADLSLLGQIAANTAPVLAAGFGGWVLLRRQEKIKREEELSAGIRKLQTEALVRVLAAFGRYHRLKTRRLLWERDTSEKARLVAMQMKDEEGDAFDTAIAVLADSHILLGGKLGQTMRGALQAFGKAPTTDEVERHVEELEKELSPWIPPLSPRPGKSEHTRPWTMVITVAIASALITWAALRYGGLAR